MMQLTTAYSLLTTLQSASAVAFSSFAVIHGAQIATAAFRGADMANQWLLLGRPFYQDQHLECIVVTGAISIHVATGLAKAAIRKYWRQPAPTSLHTMAGYTLVPLLWTHYDLARRLPARHFGDSAMVDFGVIAWGLQHWPKLTYAVHGALVGTAVYHIVYGVPVAYQRLALRPTTIKTSLTKRVLVAGVSTILLTGLAAVAHIKKIPLRRDYATIYNMFCLRTSS